MNFQGKNVYISGGSSGIGLATAALFLSKGANVLIFARDAKRLQDAEKALQETARQSGARVAALSIDVADHAACEAGLRKAVEEFGVPFVVINSAGIGGAKKFEEESFEKFDQRLKVNLYGVRNVIAAVLPAMKAAGGHIVNVSSLAGVIGVFGFTSYAASKFGVVGFSEALRCELKPQGIWVSVFCPPDVDTPMLEAESHDKPPETKALSANGGVMRAEDAAAELIKGIESKRFMVLPGMQSRFLHLINRWAPALRERIVDRIIAKAQAAR
jgi:short-subunit dehydrogenase